MGRAAEPMVEHHAPCDNWINALNARDALSALTRRSSEHSWAATVLRTKASAALFDHWRQHGMSTLVLRRRAASSSVTSQVARFLINRQWRAKGHCAHRAQDQLTYKQCQSRA